MGYVYEKQVLDHGYLKSVECWGSDEAIVEAARISTQKGFLGWGPRCQACDTYLGDKDKGYVCCDKDADIKQGDEKLLRYLWENKHATPFEMAGAIVEVQAPIFVFREWHRHRTQSYNEMSARYIPLPDVNYVPTVDRLMVNAGGSNKQAGTVAGSDTLTVERAETFRRNIEIYYSGAEALYKRALADGVPKELARVHLPVGRYSRMRASANLRNWLAFATLRSAPSAQWEIRQYSDALVGMLSEVFPRTMENYLGGPPRGRPLERRRVHLDGGSHRERSSSKGA